MNPVARVLPSVPLLFPCERIEVEEADAQVVVLNPLAAVALPPGASFPFNVDELWVYAQLTDGVGTFQVAVEMRQRLDDGTERVVGRTTPVTIPFPGGGQLGVIDAAFCLTDVPIDEPGLYEFRVLADDDELEGHTPTLRMLDLETPL
jgi:hypothetical protein